MLEQLLGGNALVFICECAYIWDVRDVRDNDGFKALANPTRRALLKLVHKDALPVGALARQLGASQPATSQHLAVLRDAGLVTVTVDGRRRLYQADDAALTDLRAFFDEYWSSAIDRLAAVAEGVAHDRSVAS